MSGSGYTIEQAINRQFYGQYTAGNGETVWNTLPDTYKSKNSVNEAICIIVIASLFELGIIGAELTNREILITDLTGEKPEEYYIDISQHENFKKLG